MRLKSIELSGFKSFAKKTELKFDSAITAIVGPNGSGKSNIAESFRFVLGEQSMKSMRGRRGEDMIWNGSSVAPRAGRASVRLVLDNADRALSLDFDEVAFERTVARDGINEYRLNGSPVRLRDIAEHLAHANIGASGHHIISQGEADRILSASSRDRREMIEDALGLTAFLYKREDAEKKLEKAAENIREVEALRRELSPHLKFLTGQIKKIEEGEALRARLAEAYAEYFTREQAYLTAEGKRLAGESEAPAAEGRELEHRIARLKAELGKKGRGDAASHELVRLEKESTAAREKRESLTRDIGRLEGELAARERLSRAASARSIPAHEAASFAEELAKALEGALELDLQALRELLRSLAHRAREFAARVAHTAESPEKDSARDLAARKESLERELAEARAAEERAASSIAELRRSIESEKDANRDTERELFAAMGRRGELEALLSALSSRRELLAREEALFKEMVGEAAALLGREALQYETHTARNEKGEALADADLAKEARAEQDERRRKIERMKIKFEETGESNAGEIIKEHRETVERDEFLARELADLAASAESLRSLIADLTKTLEERFVKGIDTITKQFDAFFKMMFGGGEAKLSVVKERTRRATAMPEDEETPEEEAAEEYEEGIEISVSLPHKRVKGLHMLSGGERALTSIALIFAMSQVNPPPFLILDETDAALDEANSRRYGDMIETLAKKSQLILITHNRETMSRAGTLYGVTMGTGGVSRLLSVQFEEALAVAK